MGRWQIRIAVERSVYSKGGDGKGGREVTMQSDLRNT